MKIDLLRERENFEEVFTITLKKFFLAKYKKEVNIKWSNFFSSKNILICNSKLNLIYSPSIDRKFLQIYASEYAYHPFILRKILQNLFVKLSTSKFFAFFFATKKLSINPWFKEFDDLCIIPGNSKIRILDQNKRCCYVILKEGYEKNRFYLEINLRKKNDLIISPKLLEDFQNLNYYTEELINALPINRTDNNSIRERAIEEVGSVLVRLYEKTFKTLKAETYLKEIYDNSKEIIFDLPNIYLHHERENIIEIINIIYNSIDFSIDDDFIVAQSHGDLQDANILFNKENTYLIDWEFSSYRSIFYDYIVYRTMARSSKNFSNRVMNFLYKEEDKNFWQNGITSRQICKNDVMIFLIEDFYLKLRELNTKSPYHKKNEDFMNWQKEYKRIFS